MTDISKGFQRLTPRIIFTQWFLLNKRDSHWGSLPWSLMLHIWDYVYIYTYIYIDILHVNLKCYLLTNICQMVILKHRKYLFSIWFSAFFGVVPCIYIYSTYQFAAPTEIGLRCSAVIVQGMIVQTAGFQAQADGHIPQSTNVVR